MIPVETAIRVFVQVERPRRRRNQDKRGWRSQRFGDRVLVFDTETTIDFSHRLLFAFFSIYDHGNLESEGLISGDSLLPDETSLLDAYEDSEGLAVVERSDFVEEIFYPEVYGLGTLCVGFNLKFDLARIAMHARCGRGKNRRRFTFVLTRRYRWPEVRIEPISARSAFYSFAPKKHLANWEKPFFRGRFLDLGVLAKGLTGNSYSLADAARAFATVHRKSRTESLGQITRETLDYGRNDVLVTWELFEKLRDEYLKQPFATIENEREQPPNSVPYTQIHSSAGIAKATLKTLGFKPLLGEK